MWYALQAPACCYGYSTYTPSSYCTSTYTGFYTTSSAGIHRCQQSPLGGATTSTCRPVTTNTYLSEGEFAEVLWNLSWGGEVFHPFTTDTVKVSYWSNVLFLIFDIRALWRSGLSARVLDQYGAEPLEQQQFGRAAGVEGDNEEMS